MDSDFRQHGICEKEVLGAAGVIAADGLPASGSFCTLIALADSVLATVKWRNERNVGAGTAIAAFVKGTMIPGVISGTVTSGSVLVLYFKG